MAENPIEKRKRHGGGIGKRPPPPTQDEYLGLKAASGFFNRITGGQAPPGKTFEPPDGVGFDHGSVIGLPVTVEGFRVEPVLARMKVFRDEVVGGEKIPRPAFGEKGPLHATIILTLQTGPNTEKEFLLYFLPGGKISVHAQEREKFPDGKTRSIKAAKPTELKDFIMRRAPEWHNRISWSSEPFYRRSPLELLRAGANKAKAAMKARKDARKEKGLKKASAPRRK